MENGCCVKKKLSAVDMMVDAFLSVTKPIGNLEFVKKYGLSQIVKK